MKISLSYSGKVINKYSEIIGCYPNGEFDSITRSTVPSLLFWHAGERRIAELARSLNLEVPSTCTIDFEHKVDPPRGTGKPSCTDVMIQWDGVAVAVEAKFTEPPYEDVSSWLKKGSENRLEVLDGWLDLISSRIEKSMRRDQVADIPYQMIHRLASACAKDEPLAVMLYQVFMPNHEKKQYYQTQLKNLSETLGESTSLKMALSFVDFTTSEFRELFPRNGIIYV